MPSVSELHRAMEEGAAAVTQEMTKIRERLELEAQPLQSATETRRPMTGYEAVSDERLLDAVFDPYHPVYGNLQLKRELKYRLIERIQQGPKLFSEVMPGYQGGN